MFVLKWCEVVKEKRGRRRGRRGSVNSGKRRRKRRKKDEEEGGRKIDAGLTKRKNDNII